MTVIEVLSSVDDSGMRIQSPGVGRFSGQPRNGTFVSAGDVVGKLQIMNTVFHLILPQGVGGRVAVDTERDRVIDVDYGRELFYLKSQMEFQEESSGREIPGGNRASGNEAGEAEEGFVIIAFTTGIFYRKPSPDVPPYVTEGQKIEKGKILGLIEVMKTFNHIVFHGTDTATTGTVKRIYMADAAEVKLGEPLFLIS